MKHFKNIAKMMMYMFLGGMMAFVCVFLSSYMKASGVAGDISRNALLLATQEGCINHTTAETFCNNMALSYGTKNLLISNRIKVGVNDDYEAHLQSTDSIANDHIWNPVGSFEQGFTNYGLISCVNNSGTNMINPENDDYLSHVQRGETLTVSATVEVFIHMNFLFDADRLLTMTFPVTAEATGISCKWFKGEAGG